MFSARGIRAAWTTQAKRGYVTKERACLLQTKTFTPVQRAYHQLTTRHSLPHMLSPNYCDGQLVQLQCALLSAEWQWGPDLMSRSIMKSLFQLCLLLIQNGCLMTEWPAVWRRSWDVSALYHLWMSANGESGIQGAMNSYIFSTDLNASCID